MCVSTWTWIFYKDAEKRTKQKPTKQLGSLKDDHTKPTWYYGDTSPAIGNTLVPYLSNDRLYFTSFFALS